MNLQEMRSRISSRLQAAGIEAYEYEAWVFLEWKLGISRADYYMDPGRELSPALWEAIEPVLALREDHMPLQYLMHCCEFMGYDFYVDEHVLIPRQDTECLVEAAYDFLKDRVALTKLLKKPSLRVLDLCTGSGCIGISLKKMLPELTVVLTDLSEGAIEVARRNARSLETDVTILQGDLFHALDALSEEERKFDLILSNPPYIPTRVVDGLMPEVRDHEPHMALDGMEDGLAFYRKITEKSPHFLKKDGALFYEIGAEQGSVVSDLLRQAGFSDVFLRKDLAGLDRIVSGILSFR